MTITGTVYLLHFRHFEEIGNGNDQPPGATRRVVPSLATGWSHHRGRNPLSVVP
jgi:hypothetical protein